MKLLSVFFCLLITTFTWAQKTNPKHMIMLGNNYFGFSGSGVTFDPESDSAFKSASQSNGELNINYAYSITNQLQLGIILQSESDTSESKLQSGEKYKNEETNSQTTIFALFNFSEDLFNSFYLGASFGSGSLRIKETNEADPSSDTDSKAGTSIFSFVVGKRFSLDGWLGIKNLVYSPNISFGSAKFTKDYKDAGIEKGTGAEINFLKFDVLF